jgi:hypothetical protein
MHGADSSTATSVHNSASALATLVPPQQLPGQPSEPAAEKVTDTAASSGTTALAETPAAATPAPATESETARGSRLARLTADGAVELGPQPEAESSEDDDNWRSQLSDAGQGYLNRAARGTEGLIPDASRSVDQPTQPEPAQATEPPSEPELTPEPESEVLPSSPIEVTADSTALSAQRATKAGQSTPPGSISTVMLLARQSAFDADAAAWSAEVQRLAASKRPPDR